MLYFIVAASALFVYLYCTAHNIGKTDSRNFLNLSAGAWSVCTLMIWIIAFPLFLINLKKLKAKAIDNPAPPVKWRAFKAFMIGLVGFGFSVLVVYSQYLERMEAMAAQIQ